MPVWLLDDSFGSLLKRTHLLDGPPNARNKVTPLRQWAAACLSASAICQQMLFEVQGHIVGAAQMDSSGKATFKAVRPGAYYVLRKAGQSNGTLSLIGTGYTYTVTNRQTGQVVSTERGNFSKTTFYLLDDDVENIWRAAGVRPFMGMSLMDSMSFYGNLGNPDLLKGSPIEGLYNFIGEGLGATDMPKALQGNARAQFECGQKAFRAHVIAETITDAAAKATFASVPAGTYYLFGQYTAGHPLTWDLKIELKPGNNTLNLSPKNAAWKYGAPVSN